MRANTAGFFKLLKGYGEGFSGWVFSSFDFLSLGVFQTILIFLVRPFGGLFGKGGSQIETSPSSSAAVAAAGGVH